MTKVSFFEMPLALRHAMLYHITNETILSEISILKSGDIRRPEKR